MVRGDLIEKITYNPLNEKQINLFYTDKWKKFRNPDHDVLIFTDDLFDAKIEELNQLYDEIKVL